MSECTLFLSRARQEIQYPAGTLSFLVWFPKLIVVLGKFLGKVNRPLSSASYMN